MGSVPLTIDPEEQPEQPKYQGRKRGGNKKEPDPPKTTPFPSLAELNADTYARLIAMLMTSRAATHGPHWIRTPEQCQGVGDDIEAIVKDIPAEQLAIVARLMPVASLVIGSYILVAPALYEDQRLKREHIARTRAAAEGFATDGQYPGDPSGSGFGLHAGSANGISPPLGYTPPADAYDDFTA